MAANAMLYIGKMPRRTEAGGICLRRFSVRDLPFVRQGLQEAGWSESSFLTWWRLRRTFSFLYLVEISGRPAGIFGVYNFAPGSSAEISLMIFDEALRRRGYGKEIFSMAVEMLRRRAFVKRLSVMIDPENASALAFWTSLGFRDNSRRGKNKVLTLELNHGPE